MGEGEGEDPLQGTSQALGATGAMGSATAPSFDVRSSSAGGGGALATRPSSSSASTVPTEELLQQSIDKISSLLSEDEDGEGVSAALRHEQAPPWGQASRWEQHRMSTTSVTTAAVTSALPQQPRPDPQPRSMAQAVVS